MLHYINQCCSFTFWHYHPYLLHEQFYYTCDTSILLAVYCWRHCLLSLKHTCNIIDSHVLREVSAVPAMWAWSASAFRWESGRSELSLRVPGHWTLGMGLHVYDLLSRVCCYGDGTVVELNGWRLSQPMSMKSWNAFFPFSMASSHSLWTGSTKVQCHVNGWMYLNTRVLPNGKVKKNIGAYIVGGGGLDGVCDHIKGMGAMQKGPVK